YGKLSPMFFTKNFQTLVSYQTNNIGADITRDFSHFSISAFRFGRSSEGKKDWLSTAAASPPPFDKKRWLDNQAHAVSANALFKDKNDFEFKVNASYINNYTKRDGGDVTTYLLPEGNTTIENQIHNNSRDESLEASFEIEQNKDKSFLKEKLTFKKEWDRGSAFLTEDDAPQSQRLRNPFTDFKNDFEIIFPWGEQLVTFDSNIRYNESPQELSLRPGVFTDILSPDDPVDKMEQKLFDKKFIANHSVDWTKRFGNFSLSLRPGIDFKMQDMDSQIFLDGNLHPDSDFQNDVKWQEISTYVRTRLSYRTDNIRMMLRLPFEFTDYKIEDRLQNDKQSKSPFTLNPGMWGQYDFWDYWKANLSLNYNKNYGPLNEMYSGYLLSNYRNLGRNDVPLMEASSQSASFGFEYRNPITTWFARINYRYSGGKNYQIFNTITQPNGATRVEALDQINKTNSNSIGISISRLISPIKTTFKIGSDYSHSNSEMLFNSELLKNTTDSWKNSLNLSGDFVDWMTVEYDGSVNLSSTENQLQDNRKIWSQNHQLGLFFYFLDNHTVSFSGEWMQSKMEEDSWSDFFGDFMYRFTLSEKRKVDFELSVINVFNKDTYRNLSVGNYTIAESYYTLRPRQFMVKVRFPL
ncbi:MAG TPA: hypothetical protein VK021_06100, partial [Flavobacteriaceae bacterium]|nr:hypothetical protein [Flavobacteriaceae bacterium]